MKRVFKPATLLIVLSFALCNCIGTNSQSFNMIRGNGNLVSKDIPVADFKAIEVSSGFDVKLVQGTTEGLTLTADENLFEVITAKVEDGVLKIYTDKNIVESKGLKARITFKHIERLQVSGGGDVTAETPITADDLSIGISGGGDLNTTLQAIGLNCNISGGGDAKINGTVKDFDLTISGGGDLTSDVAAEKVDFNISGGGDVNYSGNDKISEARISISGGGDLQMKLNAEQLNCSLSGGGDATLSGQATNFEVSINGGGDVHAGNLNTQTITFQANGGSDITVNVSKELKGSISGGGNVYFSGNPDVVDVDAKGGSEVHKQ